MIFVMLMKCGLGNQMFTYAYARYLQEKAFQKNNYKEKIGINAYQFIFGTSEKIVEERQLSLQNFKLCQYVDFLNEESQKENQEHYLQQKRKSMSRIDHWIRNFFHSKKLGELNYKYRFHLGMYYSYRPHSSFRTILSKHENKYVYGYYQDAKPLLEIKGLLKQDFTILTPPNEKTKDMLEKIQSTDAVCLHIRRGDYLIPECRHLNICNQDYYQRGIEYIQKKVKNPTFFVFSNTHADILWIKNNFHFEKGNFIYVDLDNPDYEDFRLMKACKHFVISNSSFSWWAAFLSEHEENIVCMPERWSLDYPDDANMYVPGWIKLPVEKGRSVETNE